MDGRRRDSGTAPVRGVDAKMSRKWRNVLIGIVVALLVVEIGLRFLLRSKATVEVVNNGTRPRSRT